MKKWILSAVVVLVIVGGAAITSDAYRYELYAMAIEFEAGQANLGHGTLKLDAGEVALLEGPRQEGQESILLLHGFGASKENWLRFAAQLTQSHHVVAIDLDGHGENQWDLKRRYSTLDQVEFVHQVAAKLELGQFHLVGNSMGGAISSLYAATYPEQVKSVVLISPAGVHDIASTMDEMLEAGQNPLIASSVEEFEALLDFVMEDKPYIPSAITKVEAEKAIARREINQKIFADLQADLERGMESKLTQIKAPVMIIWGEQDRAINVKNIDKYATLVPNAQKMVMPGIGHLAMIERPKVSAIATRNFIRDHAL